MVKVIRVQINDPMPSARVIASSVRSVLWGIVEIVILTDALEMHEGDQLSSTTKSEERSDNLPGDDQLILSSVECKESSSIDDTVVNDDLFQLLQATSRSLLEKEMNDIMQDVSLDNQLPLSFGRPVNSSNQPKKKKKKNKKPKPVMQYYDDSGVIYYEGLSENPADFVWNILLPLPQNHYFIGGNCYCIRERAANIFLTRTIRVIGCGPSSTSGSAATTGETVIAEYLDVRDAPRFEIARELLIQLRKADISSIRDGLMDALYQEEVQDPPHQGKQLMLLQ